MLEIEVIRFGVQDIVTTSCICPRVYGTDICPTEIHQKCTAGIHICEIRED